FEPLYCAPTLRAPGDSRYGRSDKSRNRVVADDFVVFNCLFDLLKESIPLLWVDKTCGFPPARIRDKDSHLHAQAIKLLADLLDFIQRMVQQAIVFGGVESMLSHQIEALRYRQLLI